MTEITYRGWTIGHNAGLWAAWKIEELDVKFVSAWTESDLRARINEGPHSAISRYVAPTATIGHKSRVYPWAGVVLGALAWIVLIGAVMAFKHWVFG